MSIVFFFNDTATTEIYTLSLHDALPTFAFAQGAPGEIKGSGRSIAGLHLRDALEDRKSTRLNSSHITISYAVFCLKKKSSIQQVPENLDSARRMVCVDDKHMTRCEALSS